MTVAVTSKLEARTPFCGRARTWQLSCIVWRLRAAHGQHERQPFMKRSKSTPPANRAERKLNRRKFLAVTGAGVSAMALLPACSEKPKPADEPKGSNAALSGAAKSDGPEVTDLRFGMIALTDCSSIVIAHEKGLFKKYGINSTVVKGASWAAIRDSLSTGDIHATHMLTGMPIASTMGLLGAPKKPMVIPWLLNRNGQAITVRADLKGKVGADPKAF